MQVTHNSISGQDVRSDSNSLSVDEMISFPWSVFDRFVRSLCLFYSSPYKHILKMSCRSLTFLSKVAQRSHSLLLKGEVTFWLKYDFNTTYQEIISVTFNKSLQQI